MDEQDKHAVTFETQVVIEGGSVVVCGNVAYDGTKTVHMSGADKLIYSVEGAGRLISAIEAMKMRVDDWEP